MIKLFQTYGSPIWPGTLPTSKPFTNNATWDESTGINVSTVFTVPNTITYRDNSFEFSNKFVQSAFRPGALPTTSLLERRPITIEGEVFMDTRADLEELERQFKRAAIRPHLKLGLDDEKYINLSALKDFSWIYRQKSGRTFAFVKVTWEAGYPFWYRWERQEAVITTDPTDFGDEYNGFTVTVDEDLATWPIYPWISFVAAGSTIEADWSLTNGTDSDANFTYGNDVTSGNTVIVHCEAGTVGGSGGQGIQHFSGQFIRLLPGANALVFAAGVGGLEFDITFQWRERWL